MYCSHQPYITKLGELSWSCTNIHWVLMFVWVLLFRKLIVTVLIGTYIHRVLAILILLSSWGVLQSGLWTCSFTVQQATWKSLYIETTSHYDLKRKDWIYETTVLSLACETILLALVWVVHCNCGGRVRTRLVMDQWACKFTCISSFVFSVVCTQFMHVWVCL